MTVRSPGGHALFAAVLGLELALGFVRFWVLALPLYLALWIGPYDEPGAATIATWAGGVGALCLPLAALLAFPWAARRRPLDALAARRAPSIGA